MLKEVTTEKELDFLKSQSACTMVGAGGDLQEWINGLTGILVERGIGKPQSWFTWNGELVNQTYVLEGDNRFQDDLTFLAFSLDGLDVGKLAIFKLEFGLRWLDDLIENSLLAVRMRA